MNNHSVKMFLHNIVVETTTKIIKTKCIWGGFVTIDKLSAKFVEYTKCYNKEIVVCGTI